ncbi:zinc metalloproteinase-disintegrin-like protein H3 [Discoglossus pictus]
MGTPLFLPWHADASIPNTRLHEAILPSSPGPDLDSFRPQPQRLSMYPDQVQYGLQLDGKPVVMHLRKTEDLVSDDYSETRYLPDGTTVTTSPENKDHCYYQGYVKNDNASLVSISACWGLSGMIHTEGRRFLIEPLKLTDTDEHAVYEAQEEPPKTCGVTTDTILTDDKEGTLYGEREYSQEQQQEFLTSPKYIQLYVVADNSTFKKYNRSAENVKRRIFEIVNFVNQVYKGINVFVAIVGMEIWDTNNQFEVVTAANETLSRFANWRKNNLLPRKPHDNAQLLTNTDLDGPVVGLAYLGTLCNIDRSTGIIQDFNKASTSVGATLAHEMGHNLGMIHDSTNCSCSVGPCIMSPILGQLIPHIFSSCSLQGFEKFILSNMPICMKDLPTKNEIQAPPVCGNKFTELGEECDCGTEQECTNQCCDAATCKFKPNATCSEGECCLNCQILRAGVVCRAAKDECDLVDMCDGKSAVCPDDHFQVNGFPCQNGKGYCYNGKCPTMQSQCASLWGPRALEAANSCFKMNTRGTSYGHCLQVDGKYIPCALTDITCGVLFCSGGTDPTIYAPYIVVSTCKAVLDPQGMVKNGTSCGAGLVCFRGKCVSLESAYGSSGCSAKCPAHSVCDHEMQCVCEEGWIPPNCDTALPSDTLPTDVPDQTIPG